ncbi:nitroreductase family protein [Actinoplanes sp. NPDC049802]|uniref:Acg family FMN-binding oxidoreductase n=1 Tax=Actinoplanes sp. NPDC049802 TaxID=3154742 RepID=UPI0034042953
MTTSFAPPSRRVLVDCVRAATTAPSLHNSQPWLFRIDGPTVEVYADPGRRLPVADPDGREHMISLGAAVLTLRVAVRRSGYRTRVELLPHDGDPELIARVYAGRPARTDKVTETLAAAIPHRHTNRGPFARVPIPPQALSRLRAAATQEAAILRVAEGASRDTVLEMARVADQWLRDRPQYAHEMRRWTGPNARHDGVPTWASGPWDALGMIPVRDFTELPAMLRPSEPFEPHPTILLLATEGDTPLDWLRAGQALQRVLLTATWLGLAATPISQPVEVPDIRRMLSGPPPGLPAQMVLRVGYGRTTGRTPRRAVGDVLLPDGPGVPRPDEPGAAEEAVR